MSNQASAVLERPVRVDVGPVHMNMDTEGAAEFAAAETAVTSEFKVAADLYCREVPIMDSREICGEVLRRFQEDEEIPCIILADDQAGQGDTCALIMRDAFYRLFAGRFASDLFYEKAAIRFAEREPLVREITEATKRLIDAALSRNTSHFYACMILTDEGKVRGVLTIQDLMMMSRSLQQKADKTRVITIRKSHDLLGRIERSVHAVSEAAERSLREAETMSRLVRAGRSELQQVRDSFHRVLSITNNQEKQVKELLQRTAKISEVTRSIRELADRSGMLAMNATIEASHAGEHGRGFAVVANEVRNLSAQTKQFSEEIGSTLQIISEMVSETASMAASSAAEVEGSQGRVAEADTTFESLVEAVQSAELRGRDMHESSDEAAHRAGLVMKELERLVELKSAANPMTIRG
ncbi:methyl-accepting chemotaxis protein [Paenibacillus sp. YPG26]|uniref:methyl-accepting chemotaxis protein n=1 Tax=Paenibacillus sp. YPG26 TaxID=2878915 RepID=UPI00203D86F8|nr:methyl-accepting chemotaxis protein [Paenibacillus sp. YPG26]USB32369.1 methyl-accepting chemotaxis protein [Paenibacillus sp. YPG26]